MVESVTLDLPGPLLKLLVPPVRHIQGDLLLGGGFPRLFLSLFALLLGRFLLVGLPQVVIRGVVSDDVLLGRDQKNIFCLGRALFKNKTVCKYA